MRRSLALLSLATTALVVISLLVPLGLLVRRQAHDAARLEAEREARTVAALVALSLSFDTPSEDIAATLGPLGEGVVVAISDGVVFGEALPGQGSLVDPAQSLRGAITGLVPGGWEIALPVIGRERVAVVDVFVTEERLGEGVVEAWLLLGLLGLVLVAVAVWVADRLGRRLVAPVRVLADAAHRLGEGDLDARVVIAERTELREVASAFNTLATRLGQLLAAEREEVADLSHRLRTPMSSLRLQAETLESVEEREEILAQVDRLEGAIDSLITAARTKGSRVGSCHLDEVVGTRVAFWSVLADEQARNLTVDIGHPVEVGVGAAQLEDVVDVLVGNVFAHTDPGVAFRVATGVDEGRAWLTVEDSGPGIADRSLVGRGMSGAGSTGLGLDIARRTAELTGGALELADRPDGGASVTVWFGVGK